MPVMKCQKNRRKGYKYGKEGHCYTGEGAESKAKRQGRAIEASRHRKK